MIADPDRRRHIGKSGLRAADGGAKARGEFGDGERLGDEIVGSGVERPHLVAFAVANGEHQNLQPGSHAAELPAGFNAADTRHVDVQQNGVEPAAFHALQGLLSVGRFGDFEAQRVERTIERAAQIGLIVGDEDVALRRHKRSGVAGRAMENIDLPPAPLSAQTRPRCASTMRLTIDSPRPVPGGRLGAPAAR